MMSLVSGIFRRHKILIQNYKFIYSCSTILKESSGNLTQDLVLRNIKSATCSFEVLQQFAEDDNTSINNVLLSQAFKTIFSLQKADRPEVSNEQILQSTEFLVMCRTLKSQVGSLELNDTISIIKTLSFLGLPASSKIFSILLNLIVKRVNDLSLQQLRFLDFIIRELKSTPIVRALRIAIPIVFEANLRTKTDCENISELSYSLKYAANRNISQNSRDFLIDNLMIQRSKFDLRTAVKVVLAICDFSDKDESHRPLLHYCFDVIVRNIDLCNYNELDIMLYNVAKNYSTQNYYFYHEDFVRCTTDFVVTNDCGFMKGIWVLRKASKVGHVNINLLKYLVSKVEGDPQLLENCTSVSIPFTFVHGLSLADYRPDNWQSKLEPLITKNVSGFTQNIELPWVNFARDMCVLGSCPSEILAMIFSSEFIDKFLSRKYNKLDYLQLLSLFQYVDCCLPSYKGPKPPQTVIDNAIKINGGNVCEYPLSRALHKAFGEFSTILNGVYTKLGHYIDHLVIFHEDVDGFIKETNNEPGSRVYCEDLPLSENAKKVVVLFLPASQYCANAERLRGPYRLNLDSLEDQGFIVVPISNLAWDFLLEQEKVPYLTRIVSEKCGLNKFSLATSQPS